MGKYIPTLTTMKKTLGQIAIIFVLIFSPYFISNEARADDVITPVASEELTGTVLNINLSLLGLSVALVIDEQSGAIYLSEATRLDVEAGDTVTYTRSTSGRIIIRNIIKK
jgi:hypothetical protein